MPVPSISLAPFAGRLRSLIGTPGKPTLTTSVMRLFCTTMSIGPRGGAPVPSITVTPRITRRSNGPSPSPAWRVGVGVICWADRDDARPSRNTTEHRIDRRK